MDAAGDDFFFTTRGPSTLCKIASGEIEYGIERLWLIEINGLHGWIPRDNSGTRLATEEYDFITFG